MKQRIIDVMERVFKMEGLTVDCSQSNCEKWDSLRHLNLIVELEDEFGTEFEPEEIAEMKSVKDIMNILTKK